MQPRNGRISMKTDDLTVAEPNSVEPVADVIVEETMGAEVAEPIETIPDPESTAKEARREKRRQRRREQALKQVQTDISACGRCSFFFADYTNLVDENKAGTDCLKSESSGWIEMPWSSPLRQAVTKSFGCRLDIDFYYYEGRCPDCGRRFKFTAKENAEPFFGLER